MENLKNDNLRELFERFFDESDARRAEDDIRKAQEILDKYPAPEPGEVLLSRIKADIDSRLQSRQSRLQKLLFTTTAAAAAIIIFVFVGNRLMETKPKKIEVISQASLIPEALWESEDIASDDPQLSTLIEQIETVESELLAIGDAENGYNGKTDFWELENEFTESESDYLKG